jgi:hypothetical protein
VEEILKMLCNSPYLVKNIVKTEKNPTKKI